MTQVSVDVHAPGPERANVQSQCQEEFLKLVFIFYQITTRFSGSNHIPSSGLTSNAL